MKKASKHIYQEQLNTVVDYIHNHLDSKIDIKHLAELSHFSPFHFHRITRALLGEPIGAYITKTRLETAAKMLRYSTSSIEEIAYNVGFETPSSLSKAFKNHFGISPSEHRTKKQSVLKTTNSMKTKLNIKRPKILNLEDQKCLYYSMQGDYKTLDYPLAWQKLWGEIKAQKLFTKGIQMLGLPHDDPNVTEPNKTRYDACLIIHKDAKPNGDVGLKTLKGGKFAMFLYQGSYKYFAEVYDFMFNDWLLQTDYELRDAPVRERYISNPERVAEEKLKTEFYIPIK
ncbi:AraC family transcriptional regulator [Winogradskyella haliclonae]|uniref:AraC family transcriptional regulator n=1 Tax=Winogradskyella haliclonae TaxID=2048558 RepID=A0ABQ2C172_9FLAO|nr:AraC family transcriptional regulator [Winogradskyella haliclonae]GGI57817.1 AraC family transcriptional regulator [Winogradskyella haliclonae]